MALSLTLTLVLAVSAVTQSDDPPVLEVGVPTKGEITEDAAGIRTDALARLGVKDPVRGTTYTLVVPESGPYHIDLRSHFFDAYLVLQDEGGAVLAEDDDGLLRTHARVTAPRLEAGRHYEVVAVALGEGRGRFTLSAHLGEPEAVAPDQQPILAVEDARDAVQVLGEVLGSDHPRVGAALNDLGFLLWSQGRFGDAEPCMRRALEIARKGFGDEDSRTSFAMLQLAAQLGAQTGYEEAQALLEQALRIQESQLGPDHPGLSDYLGKLAEILLIRGRLEEARPLLERSVRICEAEYGPDHPTTGMSLNNLAYLFQTQGRYDQALPLTQRALRILETHLGPDHPYTATTVNNLATMMIALGNREEARPLLERVLRNLEGSLGPDHPQTMLCLGNMAVLLKELGRFDEARPMMERVLQHTEAQLGPDHPVTARSLGNLASVLHGLGDPGAARPLAERALQINEAQLGLDHPETARTLNNLAELLDTLGHPEEARPLKERVLQVLVAQLGPDHPKTFHALGNLARVLRDLGQSGEARAQYVRALEVRHRLLTLLAPALSEREYLLWLSEMRSAMDEYLDLPGGPDVAREQHAKVLAFKGLVSQQLRQQQAWRQQHMDEEVAGLSMRLQGLLAELSEGFRAASGPVAPEAVADLLREKERLERELASHAAGTSMRQAPEWEAVAGALEQGDALVDLFSYTARGEARILAFVLRPGGETQRVDLGPVQELRRAVQQHLGQLRGFERSSAGITPPRDVLWAPLAAHLGDARRIFISPDGVLATLPFGTFPGDQAGTFLVEQYTFIYLQTAGDLVRTDAKVSGEGALIVGGIDYRNTREDPAEGGAGEGGEVRSGDLRSSLRQLWKALPATRQEAEELAFYFNETHDGEALLLVGDEATERRIRREVAGRRFVHLATHGYFAPEYLVSATDSARQAATGHAGLSLDEHRTQLAGWMPGLLSGMVFAGANRGASTQGADDGLLTASEAIWLDLRGCELVTLSACETGLGVARDGEHLMGLRRAIQIAGARSTITSLWKVDDEATQELMQDLYERLWVGQESRIDALRNAQLAMLRKNRAQHQEGLPRTWGAFVLEGDWR